MKCGKCGKGMVMIEKKKGKLELKTCWYENPYGIKCGNSAGSAEIIERAIFKELAKYEEQIINENTDVDKKLTNEINYVLEERIKLLNTTEKAAERIHLAYENRINSIQEKLMILGKKDRSSNINLINEFRKNMEKGNLSYERLNEVYHTIIDYIIWERNGNEIKIDIRFL